MGCVKIWFTFITYIWHYLIKIVTKTFMLLFKLIIIFETKIREIT